MHWPIQPVEIQRRFTRITSYNVCYTKLLRNPASNHPRLIVKLVEMRERGGTVIVVNPVRELGLVRFRIPSRPGSLLAGSRVSDIYLQPHVGGVV